MHSLVFTGHVGQNGVDWFPDPMLIIQDIIPDKVLKDFNPDVCVLNGSKYIARLAGILRIGRIIFL